MHIEIKLEKIGTCQPWDQPNLSGWSIL